MLAVEILDFVKIEESSFGGKKTVRRGNHLFDVGNPGGCGIQFIELHSRRFGDDVRNGGFARAGRSEENHIREPTALAQTAENAVFPDEVRLSRDLVKVFRSHTVG